jgi:GH35 family endo-1,4-beta-xylanase
LYDVIGIQSHMHGGVWPVRKTWEVCERFKRFGVPLHFTEVTILSGEPGWELTKKRTDFDWESTPKGLQRQAEQAEQFYTLLFSHPAVEAITWWDLSDQHAWQRAPAGWLDDEMRPKPVFKTMRELIKQRWWTRLDRRTDERGKVTFRGYRGTYEVKVRAPDGRTAAGSFTLAETGRLEITLP